LVLGWSMGWILLPYWQFLHVALIVTKLMYTVCQEVGVLFVALSLKRLGLAAMCSCFVIGSAWRCGISFWSFGDSDLPFFQCVVVNNSFPRVPACNLSFSYYMFCKAPV
jgi:hypothetical protein